MRQPFFQFRDLTESDSHKIWVRDIKSQKMPRLSAPPSEVTPIFLPVEEFDIVIPLQPPERDLDEMLDAMFRMVRAHDARLMQDHLK